MSTIRFFQGSRDLRKRGPAAEQMIFEIQKKGKMPTADRYKRMVKKKLEENKLKALGPQKKGFSLSDPIAGNARKLSKRAEQTLKEIAMKKARKEAKAMRQMVIVQPRVYANGSVNKKGQIYDVAGNMVATINTKNGKIATALGTSLGKYKPKSYFNDLNIQNGIKLHSPYFIQQRRMQMLQQQGMTAVLVHGPMGPETINVYGHSGTSEHQNSFENSYGAAPLGPRQNIGVNAWGAQSDNIWGTFADNAWGTSTDNVWGTNTGDVWGGVGPGNLWGAKGPHIWGTGNGKNYLKFFTNAIAALFGLKNKNTRQKVNALRAAGGRGQSGRPAAPTTARAPARTR